jgi:DNA polymerase-1
MTFAPATRLCDSLDRAEQVADKLYADAKAGKPFSFDIETGYDGESRDSAQLHPEEGFVAGIGLTNSLNWAFYLPLRHDSGPNLDNSVVAALLWPLLRTGMGVAHNAKFELRFLSRWFTEHLAGTPLWPEVAAAHLGNPRFTGYFPVRSDTMLELHAEGKSRSLGLKAVTAAIWQHQMTELADLFALVAGKPLTKKQLDCIRFSALDLTGPHREKIISYACEDVIYTLAHHRRLHEAVAANFIYKLEMAVVPVVCAMEDEGVLLDWQYMREGNFRALEFRDKLTTEIHSDLTGMLADRGITEPCNVNLGSWQQLGRVLYEQLGMPVRRRSRQTGSASTDKIALKGLSQTYPVVQKVLHWKSLTKLSGTYLGKYENNYSYAPDGRTHPNHIQTGVPAGRFAVSDWPYQQSPKVYHYDLASGEAFDFNFRDGVRAPTGWYILGYDYAQMELRVLAAEAGETALLDAFNRGDDPHITTAALMLGILPAQVTKDQRGPYGKTMNFALSYQMGVDGLADRLGIPKDAAQERFDRYFTVYSKIKGWLDRTVAEAEREGCVWTRFGRRVPIWEFQSRERYIYAEGQRLAGNAPIQGAGTGDYPKIAMVRATAALKRAGLAEKVRLVMNVHDALYFYVRKDVAPLHAIQVLQPAVIFTMPVISHWPKIEVDWSMGERWGSMFELDVKTDPSGAVTSLSVVRDRKAPQPTPEDVDDDRVAPVQPPGSPDELQRLGRDNGNGHGAGPGRDAVFPSPVAATASNTVIIALQRAVDQGSLGRLLLLLRSQPGPNQVILGWPGEAVCIAQDCALTPAQQAEVALLLGQPDAVVRFAPPV